MKRALFIISCLLCALSPLTASAAIVTKVTITTAEPKVGEKLSFKATVPPTASSEVYETHWAGEFDNGVFIQGNDYTITVKLRIKSSSANSFSSTGKINATVNGQKAQVVKAYDKNITVKYTWKMLGGENPNNPKYKLKVKLGELAKAFSATNASTHKDVLAYLRGKLPNAEIWSAGVSSVYARKMPTETQDGHLSVPIGIKCDGVTLNQYYFVAVLPALNKSPESIKLNADMALMKEALSNLMVTAKTTGKDVLKAVNDAAQNGATAVWDKNYRYEASTSNIQGSISGNLIVTLGDKRDIISVHKGLPINGTAADAAIDADYSEVSRALHNYSVDNCTTEQELIDVANNAIKKGSKLTVLSCKKSEASYDREGKISISLKLERKGETRSRYVTIKLSKLRAELPKEISVTQDEWEVLRLTNIERYKTGAAPLAMVAPLVDAADIRVKEIVSDYRSDHRRPDGSKFSTAVDPSFAAIWKFGENAYESPLTPSKAVEGWMKSPGHKANILMKQYNYIGCGVTGKSNYKYWIQMFAIGRGIINARTSTGSNHFKSVVDMERAYLICDTVEGIVGYIPLEADYMVKNGNQYTIYIRGVSVTVTVDK